MKYLYTRKNDEKITMNRLQKFVLTNDLHKTCFKYLFVLNFFQGSFFTFDHHYSSFPS